MSPSSLDAVVIGAGPNGLAAAIELARAGRAVRVYETRSSVGGGTRSTELTAPGFIHDVCSAVHPFLLASPFLRSLPLRDLGIEAIQPEIPLAHPLEGGGACALYRSVDETAEEFGVDGPAYTKLMRPLVNRAEAIIEGALGPLRVPRHPLVLAAFGARALLPATTLIRRTFTTESARGLFAGIAAHSMLPLSSSPTAGVAVMLALLAHHAGWPVVRGGSQKIADGLESFLLDLGGEIVTDHEVISLRELPPARAYLFDVGPRQILRIAGDRFAADTGERSSVTATVRASSSWIGPCRSPCRGRRTCVAGPGPSISDQRSRTSRTPRQQATGVDPPTSPSFCYPNQQPSIGPALPRANTFCGGIATYLMGHRET